jgi:hypothetical protein
VAVGFLVDGKVVVEVGNAETAADPAQPKEGPLDSRIEHLEGVNGKSLPTGITN